MSDEGVTCRYVFTEAEYKAAMRGMKHYPPQTKWPVIFVFILFFGSMVFHYSHPDSSVPTTVASWIPELLPVLLVGALFVWLFFFAPGRAFRKGDMCNLEMSYRVSPEGLHQSCSLLKADIAWRTFSRWEENTTGFSLYVGRFLHWLPKHGMGSLEQIDKLRALLAAHVQPPKKARFQWRIWLFPLFAILVVAIYWFTNSSSKVQKLNREAYLLEEDGENAKALEVRKKAMESCQWSVRRNDPVYAYTECRLANTYRLLQEYDKATPLMKEALKTQRANLPLDHPDVIETLNLYSLLCYDTGRYEMASELAGQAYHLALETYGKDNGQTLMGMANLALAYDKLDRTAEARKLWEECLEIKRRTYKEPSYDMSTTLIHLGHLASREKNYAQARDLYEEAYAIRQKTDPHYPGTAMAAYNVGYVLIKLGKPEEARPYLQACLKIQEERLGTDDADTVDTRDLLKSLDEPPKKSTPPGRQTTKGAQP